MAAGFSIRGLEPANSSGRGRRTWEWRLPDGRQVTIYRRSKGEVFAAHFHKGEDPAKKPERWVLLEGRMSMVFENVHGHRVISILDAKDVPVEVTIEPGILHTATALSDCLYIEYRQRYFDPERPDTYSAAEFAEFARTARHLG